MRSLRARAALLVGVLVALLAAVTVATTLAFARASAAQQRISEVLRPAQTASIALTAGYVDQETGERGYVLTGDPSFLQPYRTGMTAAVDTLQQLSQLLPDDTSQRLLDTVVATAATWREQTAEPEIDARRAGHVPTVAEALTGKARFDALRARLAALDARVGALLSVQAAHADAASRTARAVALCGLLAAALIVLAAIATWRRSVAGPLAELHRQVRLVSAGDLDHPVTLAAAPVELRDIAESVESMRAGLLEQTAESAAWRSTSAVAAEHERMAADLHDTVIQALFGTGLRLQSIASKYPQLAPVLNGVVLDLDGMIRQLRTAIFGLTARRGGGGLREQVLDVVGESERTLGFAPRLQLDGPLDTVGEGEVGSNVVAALRELLSNVAKHARARTVWVTLTVADGVLRVVVADDGVGVSGPANGAGRGQGNLRGRAGALGGSYALEHRDGGGSVATWTARVGGTVVDVRGYDEATAAAG